MAHRLTTLGRQQARGAEDRDHVAERPLQSVGDQNVVVEFPAGDLVAGRFEPACDHVGLVFGTTFQAGAQFAHRRRQDEDRGHVVSRNSRNRSWSMKW